MPEALLILLMLAAALGGLLSPVGLLLLRRRLARLEAAVRAQERAERRAAPPAAAPAASLRPAASAPAPAPAPPAPAEAAASAPASQPPPLPDRPAPAPVSPSPAPPRRERARIEWERWIGVRGAGVLGGLAAALAGILFLQHAITEGWISEWARVGMAAGAGLVLVGIGEWLRPRRYRWAPDSLIGAGAALLYASLWAGSRRYGLWPDWPSFVGMALVTGGLVFLARRHASRVIAALGLLGGFATPLLLSTYTDEPLSLFAYLLVLDAGLLALGRRLAWGWLAPLGLLGTVALQALWFAGGFGAGDFSLALVVLGGFGLLFAVAERGGGALALTTRAASLVLPFAFALHLASRAELSDERLWPLAALALALVAGAAVLARRKEDEVVVAGTVAGALALLVAWTRGRELDLSAAWPLVVSGVALAVLPAVAPALRDLALRRLGRAPADAPSGTGTVAAVGAAWLLLGFGAAHGDLATGPAWGVGFAALTLLATRARGTGAGLLPWLAAVCAAVGLAWQVLDGSAPDPSPELAGVALATLLGTGAVLLVAGRFAGRWVGAAGLYAVLLLWPYPHLEALEPFGVRAWALGGLALTALAAFGAARTRWSVASPFAAFAAVVSVVELLHEDRIGPTGFGFAVLVATGAALALAPFVGRGAAPLAAARWSAAVALLWLLGPLADQAYHLGWGASDLLAAGSIASVSAVAFALRREARAAFGLAAVVALAFGVGQQAGHAPVIVGLGLSAAGLGLLWRRVDAPTLKAAATLAAMGAAALVLQRFVDVSSWAREGTPLANSLAWVHACAFAGPVALAAALARVERERFTAVERRLLPARPYATWIAGASAAVVAFLWTTLTVLEVMGEGDALGWPIERDPRLDLALSLAWAGLGLTALVLGLALRSQGPRWLSLVVLLGTIGKVFLHDLGDLEGLERVGSLAGLAVSLILVSLLYQRFVFGRDEARDPAAAGDGGG